MRKNEHSQDVQISTDSRDRHAGTNAAMTESAEEIALGGRMVDVPHPKEPTQGIQHDADNLRWNTELWLVGAMVTSD